MTPTPSKPDLVALADEQDALAKSFRAMQDDEEAGNCEVRAKALRHLASQPSLYEAGLRVSRREILDRLNLVAPAIENLTEYQEQCDADGIIVKVSRQAVDEVVKAVNDVALIAALPADGGERGNGGRAVIEGDAVVIRFPLDAMQTAMDGAWSLRAFDTRYKITDINEFAKEFRNALNREDERGTTEIHKMADRAFIDCIESGAFGIEEHEQQDL